MGTISKRKHRSFLPASSQLRYAAAYILITAAALFLLNLYASTTIRSMTFHAQADSLESKAQLLSNALLQLDELSAGRAAQAVNSMEELHTTRTVVTDAAGVAVYDSLTTGNAEGKTLLFPELITALEGSDVFFARYADGAVESHAAVPLIRGGKTLGAVYLMSYDTDQGELIAALERNILRISFALEGGVVLFSLFFSAAFSRRMRAILNQVGRMREGDYSQQPPVRGHDEVERLSRAFNELAARLESSEARRRQFVSDASHELKTPLASIKLLSDSILQNEMDPETQREFIGDIGREADRLGRLTQKLLTLTKLDSSVEEEREILDAAPVVRKVVRMLLPLARLRGIGIDTTFEPDCSVMTVEDDLYQIVFNLTENAIKYNRQDGWVGVSVRRADCPNASPEKRKEQPDRWIKVSWGSDTNDSYPTVLEVVCKDRQSLLLDISAALSSTNTFVLGINSRSTEDQFAIFRLEVRMRDSQQLSSLMNRLHQISGVLKVTRPAG